MQSHLPKGKMRVRREVGERVGGKLGGGKKRECVGKALTVLFLPAAPNSSTLALHRSVIKGKLGHLNLSFT